MKKKIKVLVIDDSALARQSIVRLLSSDHEIEVMDTAMDPYHAVSIIKNQLPDVITLDIEMPKMDGITFLKKIMSQHPIPVVIISSLTDKGSETAIKALESGAVEILHKPRMESEETWEEYKIIYCEAVKAAAEANVKRRLSLNKKLPEKLSTDAVIETLETNGLIKTTEKVIAIGASTGGTDAIRLFLESMPVDCPGIVIVQHMPELFTRSFAKRLNDLCRISVKEAEDGDKVLPGRALIAPGNYHMLLKRSGARYFVKIKKGPLVNRHRPSVDVLFRSTAYNAGKNCVGVILTGMGNDGAHGMLEMKNAGAMTIAQDEKSCVVFGMPKEAIKLNAVAKILSLDQISYAVLKYK
jgi:two-component system, chemotaxis family, protein-glutamate methylesterase/glutaminase